MSTDRRPWHGLPDARLRLSESVRTVLLSWTGLMLAAPIAVPGPLGAQDPTSRGGPPPWSLDLRLGYANATGDLGDLSDEGFLGGVGLSRSVTSRLALRADLSLQRLRRAGRPRDLGGIVGPRTEVWHFLGATEVELTGASAEPWNVWAIVGAGASFLDVSGTLDGGSAVPDQTEWKPTVGLALAVGYGLARRLALFGRSEVFLMLGDRTSPGEFLGKEAVMGTSLGLRFSL